MYTVYGMSSSGNCHKLRLLLDHLGLPFRWQEVDITTGASRQPDFLALNANGRVPVLQLDNGETLAESNAILCFLAEDTRLWPGPRLARARTLQWLFFEQYSHEPISRWPATSADFFRRITNGGQNCPNCTSAAGRRWR